MVKRCRNPVLGLSGDTVKESMDNIWQALTAVPLMSKISKSKKQALGHVKSGGWSTEKAWKPVLQLIYTNTHNAGWVLAWLQSHVNDTHTHTYTKPLGAAVCFVSPFEYLTSSVISVHGKCTRNKTLIRFYIQWSKTNHFQGWKIEISRERVYEKSSTNPISERGMNKSDGGHMVVRTSTFTPNLKWIFKTRFAVWANNFFPWCLSIKLTLLPLSHTVLCCGENHGVQRKVSFHTLFRLKSWHF